MTERSEDPIRNIGPGDYLGEISKRDDPGGSEAKYFFSGCRDVKGMPDVANTVDPVPERFLNRRLRLTITEEGDDVFYKMSQKVELISD